jgi:hypothetical protein
LTYKGDIDYLIQNSETKGDAAIKNLQEGIASGRATASNQRKRTLKRLGNAQNMATPKKRGKVVICNDIIISIP